MMCWNDFKLYEDLQIGVEETSRRGFKIVLSGDFNTLQPACRCTHLKKIVDTFDSVIANDDSHHTNDMET